MFETVAIFIGIFGAFTLDSWNRNRLDRKEEVLILKEISEDLSAGMQRIVGSNNSALANQNAMKIVIKHVANDLPYHDSLNHHFYNIHSFVVPEFPFSAFESLKSNGFSLISNSRLRRKIISMFELTLPAMREGMTEDGQKRHDIYLRTAYIKYFTLLSSDLEDDVKENRDENLGTNAVIVPVNYDELIKDQQYENLLREMYNNITWMTKYMYNVTGQVRMLKIEIDEEIDHLQ